MHAPHRCPCAPNTGENVDMSPLRAINNAGRRVTDMTLEKG